MNGLDCGYFRSGVCRSCSEIEKPVPEQLKVKENRLREALSFIPSFSLEQPFTALTHGFRHRVKLSVTGTASAPVIGLLGTERLDEGRDLLECPIHHPTLNRVVAALPKYIERFQLGPYRIAERKGELKGIIAFYSEETDEAYLRFVLRSKECVSRLIKMLPELQSEFPFLVCVSANIQPIPHAILEGPEEIFITERKNILHRVGDARIYLSPRAFVQTNSGVASELYRTAGTWATESGAQRMLELYCGQGAFSFHLAKSAREVLGIDSREEAVQAANFTAHDLGLGHVQFRTHDAAQVSSEAERFDADLILVNPPRAGLRDGVEVILRAKPRHFFYSSCSVETLARDLQRLAPHYEIKRVRIFDMFPHTEHFETLAWLTRI